MILAVERFTLFGEALKEALEGGASDSSKIYVTASMLFNYLTDALVEKTQKLEKAKDTELLLEEKEDQKAEVDGTQDVDDNDSVSVSTKKKKKKKKKKEKSKDKEENKASKAKKHTKADSPRISQTPVFAVPRDLANAADFPVCFVCGPPAGNAVAINIFDNCKSMI